MTYWYFFRVNPASGWHDEPDCFPFPAFSDAGTYLITQVGNAATLVNETYDKIYFGSAVDEGSRIKYEVESSYGYFGGTMSEAFIFYINK